MALPLGDKLALLIFFFDLLPPKYPDTLQDSLFPPSAFHAE